MAQQNYPSSLKPVGLFLVLTIIFSSPFWYLISVRGGFGTYYTYLMWAPGAAAIATLLITKKTAGSLGWHWGNWKFQLAAAMSPLLYFVPAYVFAWAFGFKSFAFEDSVTQYAPRLGFEGAGGWPVILGYVIVAGVAFTMSNMVSSMGEEVGWRGFLFPQLMRRMGLFQTSLLVGLIWALWHFPLPSLRPDVEWTPELIWGLAGFTINLILISFIFAYFMARTGSVWTAAFIHSGHNAFLGIFRRLTVDADHQGPIYYYVGEEGVFTMLFALITAIFFYWLYRRDRRLGLLYDTSSNPS